MELSFKLQVSRCAHKRTHIYLYVQYGHATQHMTLIFMRVVPGAVGAVLRHGAEHDLCSGR